MRNLQDALKRAESLRDFRKVNEVAFEKNDDFQDIVNLAGELERTRRGFIGACTVLAEKGEDDHDESLDWTLPNPLAVKEQDELQRINDDESW